MIYPKKLQSGDLVKIISPSNGVEDKKIYKLENAIEYLKSKGFNVNLDKYVRCSVNGMSCDAISRASELNNSIGDNSSALIACSGGDFLIQILEYVDFNKILSNIKWIQGHSDITSLLYYITTYYDIATIYSFNVKTFGDESIPSIVLDNDISFLKNSPIVQKEYGYRIDDFKKCNWECITTFREFKGRIIGGCLDVIKDIIGTKYDNTLNFIEKYKDDGIVWYFDIFSMTNEDILRTMWQLKELGWFKYTKGILFGRLYEEVTYTGITLKDSIKYYLDDLNVPVIINVDIGHTNPVMTIVNGSIVKISYDSKYEIETFYE